VCGVHQGLHCESADQPALLQERPAPRNSLRECRELQEGVRGLQTYNSYELVPGIVTLQTFSVSSRYHSVTIVNQSGILAFDAR